MKKIRDEEKARIFSICERGFPEQERAKNKNFQKLNLRNGGGVKGTKRTRRKLPDVEYCFASS